MRTTTIYQFIEIKGSQQVRTTTIYKFIKMKGSQLVRTSTMNLAKIKQVKVKKNLSGDCGPREGTTALPSYSEPLNRRGGMGVPGNAGTAWG